jgi:hypothetical protein
MICKGIRNIKLIFTCLGEEDAVVDDCCICDANNSTCTPYAKSEVVYTILGILLFVYSITLTQ